MKRILYVLLLAVSAAICFSCSDMINGDEDKDDDSYTQNENAYTWNQIFSISSHTQECEDYDSGTSQFNYKFTPSVKLTAGDVYRITLQGSVPYYADTVSVVLSECSQSNGWTWRELSDFHTYEVSYYAGYSTFFSVSCEVEVSSSSYFSDADSNRFTVFVHSDIIPPYNYTDNGYYDTDGFYMQIDSMTIEKKVSGTGTSNGFWAWETVRRTNGEQFDVCGYADTYPYHYYGCFYLPSGYKFEKDDVYRISLNGTVHFALQDDNMAEICVRFSDLSSSSNSEWVELTYDKTVLFEGSKVNGDSFFVSAEVPVYRSSSSYDRDSNRIWFEFHTAYYVDANNFYFPITVSEFTVEKKVWKSY